jgi:HK97 family phage major capsid protein
MGNNAYQEEERNMANQIPLSGASEAAGGALLPSPLVATVVEQIQRRSGALDLVDTATTNSRKETIPVYKGRPQAQFVNEGAAKPIDGAEFGTLTLNVKKLAVIVPFTDEVLADAQDDPAALVTPDVIAAFADAADNAIVNGSGFDSNLTEDADDSVELGSDGDAVRKAVSAAMGKLEANGYAPTGVLLGGDSAQVVRDARSEVDNTKDVYSGVDPFYGLTSAVSTNLVNIGSAEAGDVVGVVADWSHARFRVRSDLSLSVSNQAAYTAGGELVSAFEKNVTLLRWEMRCGFVITDPRAVVTITA